MASFEPRLCVLGACLILSATLACERGRNPGASVEPEPRSGSEPTAFVEQPEIAPAPTCRARTPSGGPSLIPDGAEWLIHIAPAELVSSQLWSSFGPSLSATSEFIDVQTSLDRCNLSLSAIDHILIGLSTANNSGTIVLTGPGLGRPEVATCLTTNFEPLATNIPEGQPLRVEPLRQDPTVQTIALGEDTVFLFHPDMLVIAGPAQGPEVVALSRCEGFPAIDHSLGELVRRTDTGAPLWFAGAMPPDAAQSLESALSLSSGSFRDLIVSARVGAGLTFLGRIGTNSPSSAQTAASTVESFLPLLRDLGPPELSGAFDRIEIEAIGAELTIQASVTDQELAQLGGLLDATTP